jgi:uncharacterized protein with PIN domain
MKVRCEACGRVVRINNNDAAAKCPECAQPLAAVRLDELTQVSAPASQRHTDTNRPLKIVWFERRFLRFPFIGSWVPGFYGIRVAI